MNMIGLVFLLLLFMAFLLIAVLIGVYVYRDAKNRGMNAPLWALMPCWLRRSLALLSTCWFGEAMRSFFARLAPPRSLKPIPSARTAAPS